MYDIVLFDLDGTLTDSGEGITKGVVYALDKMGVEHGPREDYLSYVGPPLRDSYRQDFSFDEDQVDLAINFFREYYDVTGVFENTVYEGIREVLEELRSRDKQVIVATSKPEDTAIKVLEHFDLMGYFDFVFGATRSEDRVEKIQVIEYALRHCKIEDKARTVMVGDRKFDVSGAAEFGIDTIGVLYGFGTLDELRNAGARFIAENPLDILKYI